MTEEVTEKQQEIVTKAAKSGNGLWIGITVLLVVILIAGAGFYLLQQLRSQGDNIQAEDQRSLENTKQINGFQEQLTKMQEQLTNAASNVANVHENFDKKLADATQTQNDKLAQVQQHLTSDLQQLQRQLGKTRGDWLIADAEYLLSVAGQRLHLVGDVHTTREALEAADERLRESGDMGAIKVREEIAKEIAVLRTIPAIDLVGIYASIQSLSARVEKLTLFLPYEGKPIPPSEAHDKHNAPSPTNYPLLDSALKQLDGYVTVRHTAQPIKAILTVEQAQFIRQQLSLKLEIIKIALVQKNQGLYQTSLTDALNWLNANFNHNAETLHFSEELQRLNTIKLNVQLPDISLSLKMLRDITKLRIEADKAAIPAKASAIETKPTATETPVIPATVPASDSQTAPENAAPQSTQPDVTH